MFERFSNSSRQIIVNAQEAARLLNHNYIGTEHLLLGVLRAPDSGGAQAVIAAGLDLDTATSAVITIIGTGGTSPEGHIPFTPRAKAVLELSLREALQLGHNAIRSEHIVLGLQREGQGVAVQVLVQYGHIDLDALRSALVRQLAADPPDEVTQFGAWPADPTVVAPLPGQSMAICARCNAVLGSSFRMMRTTAVADDGESRDITLVLCPTCGGTLGVLAG
jgi:ATP-dependent Clp protease ATP-binding subunit ClpC